MRSRTSAGLPVTRRRRWSTWAHTHTCHPWAWVAATSVPEVRATLALARRAGVAVRPAGAGRSSSALAMCNGVVLDLTGMDTVLRIDRVRGEVDVEPGITIRRLARRLWAEGLALETVGDCDDVTVGGAIATAMHASGAGFGSISSRVRELDLVLPDGSLVTASPTSNPRLYAAARVGLGAFGVITRVRLACVPAFALHIRQFTDPGALESVEWLVAEHDHVDLIWYPQTDSLLVRTLDRVPLPPQRGTDGAALPGVRTSPLQWLRHGALDATGLVVEGRVGAIAPRVVPAATRAQVRIAERIDEVRPAHAGFVTPHPLRHRTSEYALARAHLGDVMREVGEWARRSPAVASLGVRVRFGAPEDAWLAPTHARHSVYVSARLPAHAPDAGWFAALQEAAVAFGGRPAWAGAHGLDAAALARLYPRFADALAVRDEVDPERLLGNGYLERVFGS